MRKCFVLIVLTAGLTLTACQDGIGPTAPAIEAATVGVSAYQEPEVVRQSPYAPPIETLTASRWVERGEETTIRLYYARTSKGEDGYSDSGPSEIVRLDFDEETLLSRPDGSFFAKGDSVLVTVTIDPVQFTVALAPAGLGFHPGEPASLRFDYRFANPDLDGNGTVDDVDETIRTSQLRVWYVPGNPNSNWETVATRHNPDDRVVKADIPHFSNYALAW